MNKLKFYKITTICLLLLNVILVSAFLITKPKTRPGAKNRLNVKEHFKMDEAQHDQFLTNVEAHHEEMKAIKEKQIEILQPYLYSVADKQQSKDQSATLHLMKELEEKKLISIYSHLEGVKSILSDDQLPLFDLFLKHRLDDLTEKNKQMRPHKKK